MSQGSLEPRLHFVSLWTNQLRLTRLMPSELAFSSHHPTGYLGHIARLVRAVQEIEDGPLSSLPCRVTLGGHKVGSTYTGWGSLLPTFFGPLKQTRKDKPQTVALKNYPVIAGNKQGPMVRGAKLAPALG